MLGGCPLKNSLVEIGVEGPDVDGSGVMELLLSWGERLMFG